MLSSMAHQQILVLLHIIHSFIPEECILETDLLKPTFDKSGGLEKLLELVPLSKEEWQQELSRQARCSALAISEIPRSVAAAEAFRALMATPYSDFHNY